MKPTTLILSLLIIVGMGCEEQAKNLPSISGDSNYKLEIIDGCQYVVFENGNSGSNNYSFSVTHKGNCNNPIH